MEIVCSRNDLLKSISIVMKAVPIRTTMKIMECVLIDASSDSIHFMTNDMELGIETTAEGNIIQKGIIAIDAKIFSDIVRKLPDNDVVIRNDESSNNIIITCEKANFRIPSMNEEDFIRIPAIEYSRKLSLSQFTLKEMIRQTIFSIATNENNPVMTGELFEIKNSVLRIVSLDGHRISIRNHHLDEYTENTKVIIPGKTLNEISKLLSGEAEDHIDLYLTDQHIIFQMENTTVVSRLITGEYFKIDNMLSSDYETKIIINKKEFTECIDRATLLIRENDKKPLVLKITDNEMFLFIDSPFGSMSESISVDKEGKDLLIGFNPRFLLDVLRSITDETITMYLINSKAPCFIRNENDDFVYLILPININPGTYNSL